MGHFITGIVGALQMLGKLLSGTSLPNPCPLTQGLAFLPLRDEDIEALAGKSQSQFAEGFNYLSQELSSALVRASEDGLFAYVETEYFGGDGAQGAVVYSQGAVAFGPKSAEAGPINEALRMLGVSVSAPRIDEFEAIGLQRHRNNEGWLSECE